MTSLSLLAGMTVDGAACFTLIVFLDVLLLLMFCGSSSWLQYVIVVLLDHTHLLFIVCSVMENSIVVKSQNVCANYLFSTWVNRIFEPRPYDNV